MLTIQELEALRGLVQINVNINLPKGHHMAYDQVRLPISVEPLTITPNDLAVGTNLVMTLPAGVTKANIEIGPSCAGVSLAGGAGLTSVKLLGLASVSLFGVHINNKALLTSADLSSLTTVADGGSIEIASNDILTAVDLSNLSVLSGDLDLSANALTESEVDGKLLLMVNATSDGATPWAGSVDLSGGTNAIPSAAGLASKATLEGRGATVTVNS